MTIHCALPTRVLLNRITTVKALLRTLLGMSLACKGKACMPSELF